MIGHEELIPRRIGPVPRGLPAGYAVCDALGHGSEYRALVEFNEQAAVVASRLRLGIAAQHPEDVRHLPISLAEEIPEGPRFHLVEHFVRAAELWRDVRASPAGQQREVHVPLFDRPDDVVDVVPIIVRRFRTATLDDQRLCRVGRILSAGKRPMAIGIGGIVRSAFQSSTMRVPERHRLDDREAQLLPVIEVLVDFLARQLLEKAPGRVTHP